MHGGALWHADIVTAAPQRSIRRSDPGNLYRWPVSIAPNQPPYPAAIPHPAHAAAIRHKRQSMVLPMIFIVLGALGTLVGMLVVLERPVTQSVLVIVVFTVLLLIGVLVLRRLDRWEPEPPHYVIGAFLWGAGVSAFISGIVNTIVLFSTSDLSFTAMYSAPLIEESTKAAFLVLVLLSTRYGRAEFNSLTDAMVYGGMVGLGFAWIEHIGYALSAETLEDSLSIILIRVALVSYLHPILTMIVAIGIWKGVTSRGLMRVGYPVLGWALAVVLHWLHNGSTQLMGAAGLGVAAVVEIVVFIALVIIGVRSRRQEHAEIVRQLPAMVYFGWITPLEAGWLADKDARKRLVEAATTDKRTLRDFIQNSTELALLRGRLDAVTDGRHQKELIQLHGELADLVSHQRPIVQQILSGRSGWAPMNPQPGPAWGPPPQQLR